MSGLSLETCLSSWKSLALTVLKLLAFNAHFKLTGPLRTHRQTDNDEHIISAIQFVHLAEIMNE